jgi:hypothetical protein
VLKKGFKYFSAIDTAFENNQIRGIGLMIQHIIKYQNNFVSSYLFKNNLLKLMARGIELCALLQSNVFVYKFEFEGWPSAHSNVDKIMKPYNGSIFEIRYRYDQVFPELLNEVNPKGTQHNQQQEISKIFKINYHINLIPDMIISDKVGSLI